MIDFLGVRFPGSLSSLHLRKGGFMLKFLILAVVVSLFAYFSLRVNAVSATSNVRKNSISKPIYYPAVLTAYVPKPGSITKSGIDANSRPGIASHLAIFPIGTEIIILNKMGGKVASYVVDDRIPAGEKESDTYAITPNDLRAGKSIHIDIRIPPKHGDGDPRTALNDAITAANKIGRQNIRIAVLLPVRITATSNRELLQKGA